MPSGIRLIVSVVVMPPLVICTVASVTPSGMGRFFESKGPICNPVVVSGTVKPMSWTVAPGIGLVGLVDKAAHDGGGDWDFDVDPFRCRNEVVHSSDVDGAAAAGGDEAFGIDSGDAGVGGAVSGEGGARGDVAAGVVHEAGGAVAGVGHGLELHLLADGGEGDGGVISPQVRGGGEAEADELRGCGWLGGEDVVFWLQGQALPTARQLHKAAGDITGLPARQTEARHAKEVIAQAIKTVLLRGSEFIKKNNIGNLKTPVRVDLHMTTVNGNRPSVVELLGRESHYQDCSSRMTKHMNKEAMRVFAYS